MFRKLFFVLLIAFIVLAVGWLAMRRGDIPWDTLETAYLGEDSQYLTLDSGTRVHFRDTGPRDAPVIVLVHGFAASLHTWEAWSEDLERDYRVISLDLPGHGLTRCLPETEMGIDAFVRTIDEVTTDLNVPEFTLVGSSMGGNTAWSFALEHPGRLEALVLVAASGWPDSPEEAGNEPLVFKLLGNPVARWLIKDLDMTGLVESGLRDSFVDQSQVTPQMVERYASMNRAPCHRAAILQLQVTDRTVATAERLSGITTPTLVLHGTGDNLVPVAHGQKFGDAIADSHVVIYDGVGHLPQEEAADQSLSDLRAFLSDRVYAAAPEPDPEPADAQ